MSIIQSFPIFYTINKKGVKKLRTYGLTYLSQDAGVMLNELIRLYESCELLTVDTALSSKQAYTEKVQAAVAEAKTTGNLKKLRSAIKAAKKETVAVNSFDWYKTWNQSLQEDAFWQQMEKTIQPDAAVQKSQLATLRNNWKLHGKFSHYSLEALVYAGHVLAVIETHLQAALAEFKSRSRKMEPEHQTTYEEYLGQSLKAIEQEKDGIIKAMLVRMQLMRDACDLTYTDITLQTIKQLKKLHALKSDTSLEQQWPPAPFNANVFLQCHRYVNQQEGTAKLDALFKLGTSVHETMPLVGKVCATQYVLMPAQFTTYVPARPALIQWLFKGHQLRYEFFKDKTALLLTLSFLSDVTVRVTHHLYLLEDPLWRTLKDGQRQVDEALQAVQQQEITGWQATFYRRTNHFLVKWQKTLFKQQQMIIEQQLTFLEAWVAVLPANHLLKQPAFSLAVHQTLTEVLDDLARKVEMTQPAHQRLQIVSQRVTDLLQKDNYYRALKENAPAILEQLAQAKTVTAEDLRQLIDYYSELDKQEQAAFEQIHQVAFNSIEQFVNNILSKTLDKLINTDTYAATLALTAQCGQFLQQSKSAIFQVRFDNLISQAIVNYENYLKQSWQLKSFAKPELLKAYEALLEQLAATEEMEQLTDAKIFRQTINLSEKIQQEVKVANTERTKFAEQQVAPLTLDEERQAFMRRHLRNQEINRKLQQDTQQLKEMDTDIKAALDRCEKNEQQCAHLLFQNDQLLQTYKLNSLTSVAKTQGQTPEHEKILEAAFNKQAQLFPLNLRK